MILVDTNVLVDVLEDDPQWADWSIGQLRAHSKVRRLVINPIIYAELSLTFSTVEALDSAIEGLGLTMIELPKPALFLAGKAFAQYRRQGGKMGNVLPDFFIGAHAAVGKFSLLTRDTRRYSSYFPSVKLIAPDCAKAVEEAAALHSILDLGNAEVEAGKAKPVGKVVARLRTKPPAK